MKSKITIEIIKYICDRNYPFDCWGADDYETEDEAESDGWREDKKGKVRCPYCVSKDKKRSPSS